MGTTTLIGDVSDEFQVCRVPAQPVVAQVIHLFLARDVAKKMSEGHQMGGYGEAIQTHASVTTPSATARGAPLPDEARTWATADNKSQINDLRFTCEPIQN